MLFESLVERVVDEPEVRQAIANLVVLKKSGEELNEAPRVEVLSRFIDEELRRLEYVAMPEEAPEDTAPLNEFFRHHCLEEHLVG